MKNQRALLFHAACFLAVFCFHGVSSPAQIADASVNGLQEFAKFNGTNGSSPVSDLIQLPSGNFLGVTLPSERYPSAAGTIYQVTPTGAIQVIYRLASDGSQGALYGGLMNDGVIQASDGKIYGLMSQTNASQGIAYRFTLPQGPFEVLHSFTLADQGNGTGPIGKLVQAPDGYLYGVCQYGGDIPAFTSGNGTIFRVGLDGSFKTVYTFPPTGAIGLIPPSGLALHPNGMLYGITAFGPASLYQFDPVQATASVVAPALSNAFYSLPPVVGIDGALYLENKGSTCGTCAGQIIRYGVDGSGPVPQFTFPASLFDYLQGSLIQVSDGSFIGVATGSGNDIQKLFQVNVATQTVTTYAIPEQLKPMIGNPTQGALGGVVGAMYQINANPALGAVLGVSLLLPKPLPSILGFYPANVAQGKPFVILGDHFVGVQSVTANGLTLPFAVMASGALGDSPASPIHRRAYRNFPGWVGNQFANP